MPSRSGSRATSPSPSRSTAATARWTTSRSCADRTARACGCRTTTRRSCTSNPATSSARTPISRFASPASTAPCTRARSSSPTSRSYFCNWTDLIVRNAVTEGGVGPFLISDEATIARAADRLAQVEVYDPIPIGSISVDAAEAGEPPRRPCVQRLLRERWLLRGAGLGLRGGAECVDGNAGRDDREGPRQPRRCRRIDPADRHRRRPRRVPARRGCGRVLGDQPGTRDQAARRARRRLRTARAQGRSGNRAGRDPRARRRNRDCERARARGQPVVDPRTRHVEVGDLGGSRGDRCSGSS